MRRIVMALFALVVISVIVVNEVPAAADWLQRTVQPERWQAAETCRIAALKLAKRPEFARAIKRGKVHDTQAGYYVRGVVIGQMGDTGSEQRLTVSCYVASNGDLVSATSDGDTAPPSRDNSTPTTDGAQPDMR